MLGRIFDIKRFAVHDGNGIRTTVFFSGCSLKCLWCHNPEGLTAKPVLAYYKHKCIGCGECVNVCPANAQKYDNLSHTFNRNVCIFCGKCEEVCPNNALKLYGKDISVDELLPILLEDEEFYNNSGGGVTLSGGECMLQYEFCTEVSKRLKEMGISVDIDTCGNVPFECFENILPYVDTFLYDLKAIDNDVHIKCTGKGNNLILENLKKLVDKKAKIEIRIPYVPDYNDNQIEKIGMFLKDLKYDFTIRVLPYHNFAGSKYEAIGIENTLPERLPTTEEIEKAKEILDSIRYR